MRVCVVGGGPAGLSTLFALTKTAGLPIKELVLYEKQSDFGGTWIFNSKTGIDTRGGGFVPSAMYADLYTNGPKETLEFSQFTFAEAFDNVSFPSFPPREVVLEYYLRFARRFQLYQYAKFNTTVEEIAPLRDDNSRFNVTSRDVSNDQLKQKEFDKVIICTGHFTAPLTPSIPGEKSFPGAMFHACELRDLTSMENKRVLAVGRSYSAESVVLEAYKHGAKQITISYRSKPNGLFHKWIKCPVNCNEEDPEYFVERPQVKSIDGSSVTFSDNTTSNFDMIILCTGYKHSFPFIDPKIRLFCQSNDLYCPMLYKGVIFENNTNISYIGMQNLFYTNTLFMQQALWLAHVFKGDIRVPPKEVMSAHTEKWIRRMKGLETDADKIYFQTDHIAELTQDANLANVDTAEMMLQWETTREEILTHREVPYCSKFNGAMSSYVGSVPWLHAKHVFDYMGESAKKLNMISFHEKLGGLPPPRTESGTENGD